MFGKRSGGGRRKFGKSFKRKATKRGGGVRTRTVQGAPMRPIVAAGSNTLVYRKHMSYGSSALQTTSPGGSNLGQGYQLSFDAAAFGNQVLRMLAAFDSYAIVNVRVTLIPQANMFMTIPGGTNIAGPLGVTLLAVDIDGALSGGPPASAVGILAHENVKTARHDQYLSSGWFQPKPSTQLLDGVNTALTIPKLGELTWIDSTNSNNINHWGVLVWVDPPQVSGTIQRYDLKVEAVIAYRIAV